MKYLLFIAFSISSLILISQEDYEEVQDDDKSGKIFFGLNLGGLKANNKTAVMYNGGYSIHQNGETNEGYYGAYYHFNEYNTKNLLDTYFIYDYEIKGYADPELMRYKTAFNIGGHAGVNINNSVAFYVDLNILKLKVEDYFTVAIQNTNDPTLIGEPELELIPIFGEERRTNINLGFQFEIYEDGPLNAYTNLFASVNTSKIEKNYFVINDVSYQIRHNNTVNGQINGVNNFQQNQTPSGVGYGAGLGLGAKYKFDDKITFDLNYYATYTKTKMYQQLQPFGLNHALVFRILWG